MLNFHWPYTPDNNYAPWYLLIWRTPWFIVMFIGRIIFCIGVAGCFLSIKMSIRAFNDMR